jgi:hypothetical protein
MDRIDMLRLHIVSSSRYRRIVNFYMRCAGPLATELSWCAFRDCLGLSGQSEVAKPDIADSHGLPLTGPSMTLTVDRFSIDLLTDRSDPGSMTTLVTRNKVWIQQADIVTKNEKDKRQRS